MSFFCIPNRVTWRVLIALFLWSPTMSSVEGCTQFLTRKRNSGRDSAATDSEGSNLLSVESQDDGNEQNADAGVVPYSVNSGTFANGSRVRSTSTRSNDIDSGNNALVDSALVSGNTSDRGLVTPPYRFENDNNNSLNCESRCADVCVHGCRFASEVVDNPRPAVYCLLLVGWPLFAAGHVVCHWNDFHRHIAGHLDNVYIAPPTDMPTTNMPTPSTPLSTPLSTSLRLRSMSMSPTQDLPADSVLSLLDIAQGRHPHNDQVINLDLVSPSDNMPGVWDAAYLHATQGDAGRVGRAKGGSNQRFLGRRVETGKTIGNIVPMNNLGHVHTLRHSDAIPRQITDRQATDRHAEKETELDEEANAMVF